MVTNIAQFISYTDLPLAHSMQFLDALQLNYRRGRCNRSSSAIEILSNFLSSMTILAYSAFKNHNIK